MPNPSRRSARSQRTAATSVRQARFASTKPCINATAASERAGGLQSQFEVPFGQGASGQKPGEGRLGACARCGLRVGLGQRVVQVFAGAPQKGGVPEEVRADHGGQSLLAPGLAQATAIGACSLPAQLAGRAAPAQALGLARAAGDLAVQRRGLGPTTSPFAGWSTNRHGFRCSGLASEQGQVEKLQDLRPGQVRAPGPFRSEDPAQLPTELEHGLTSSRGGTIPRT
jgi:hypothetical protein